MSLFSQLTNVFGGNSNIKRISSTEAKKNLDTNNKIVLLDVRESYEYQSGHIKAAKNIPVGAIGSTIQNVIKNKDTVLYVYCQSGARSSRACKILDTLGFTNIYNLGGIISWPYGTVTKTR